MNVALLLAPALLLPQAAPGEESERTARTFVEALRSEKAEDRDLATRKLCDLGEAARSVLDSVTRGEDPEAAERARFILRVIQVRRQLTRNLLETFRGLDFQLASGDSHEWTAAFLACRERNAEGRRKHPGLGRSDVEPLAAPALRGARTPGEMAAVAVAIGRRVTGRRPRNSSPASATRTPMSATPPLWLSPRRTPEAPPRRS